MPVDFIGSYGCGFIYLIADKLTEPSLIVMESKVKAIRPHCFSGVRVSPEGNQSRESIKKRGVFPPTFTAPTILAILKV